MIVQALTHPNARWKILLVSALFFLLVFGWYYPSYYTSGDEHQYVTNAALITQGDLTQESNHYYCALRASPNGYFSPYPIGKSLQLIPFLNNFLSVIFWSGALIHIINFFLIILIFRRTKTNECWSLIYIFFPAFQWSARTLFPELSVLTFFLAAYYAWLHTRLRHTIMSGFLLGCALFFRTDAFLGMIAFTAQAILRERSRVIPLLIGFLIPLAVLLVFNASTYHALLPQAGSTSSILGSNFGWSLLLEWITFLVLLLIITPPLSGWAIWKHASHRILFMTLVLGTSIFFVRFYSFWSLGTSIPHIFTVRLRYFIPAIGLLIIPAAQAYSHIVAMHIMPFFSIMNEKKRTILTGIMVVLTLLLLGAGTIVIHAQHGALLDSRRVAFDAIHASIPENAIVIGSADDCIYFLPEISGMKKYYHIDNLPDDFVITKEAYFISLSYATQRDSGTVRQPLIDAERQKMQKYVDAHASNLKLIFSYRGETYIDIWQGFP